MTPEFQSSHFLLDDSPPFVFISLNFHPECSYLHLIYGCLSEPHQIIAFNEHHDLVFNP